MVRACILLASSKVLRGCSVHMTTVKYNPRLVANMMANDRGVKSMARSAVCKARG